MNNNKINDNELNKVSGGVLTDVENVLPAENKNAAPRPSSAPAADIQIVSMGRKNGAALSDDELGNVD